MRFKGIIILLLILCSSRLTFAQDERVTMGSFRFRLDELHQVELDGLEADRGYTYWLFEVSLMNREASEQCFERFDIRFWYGDEDDLSISAPDQNAMSKIRTAMGIDYPNVCLDGQERRDIYIIAELPENEDFVAIHYRGRRVAVIEITDSEEVRLRIGGASSDAVQLSFNLTEMERPSPILLLDFGAVNFYLESSFYFGNTASGSVSGYVLWVGYFENLSSDEACIYSENLQLSINNNLYTASADDMSSLKEIMGLDYPGDFLGQCVPELTTDVYTFITFEIPTEFALTDVLFDGAVVATIEFSLAGEVLNIINHTEFTFTNIGVEAHEETINTFDVNLPNCEGTSELTVEQSYEFSVERSRTITASVDASINATATITESTVPVFDIAAVVYAEANASYNVEDFSQNTITTSQSIIMSAAPGTSTRYSLAWVLTSYQGTGLLEYLNADPIEISFVFDDSLRLDVLDSENVGCE
jgi:hypothetical protein